MEGRLGVPSSCRFPLFKQLYWSTAQHYLALLNKVISRGEDFTAQCLGKRAAIAMVGFRV